MHSGYYYQSHNSAFRVSLSITQQCILGIVINHTTVHSGYQYLFHHIASWVSLLIIPLCSLNILTDHTTLDSAYPFQLHQILFLMSSFYVYQFLFIPFLELLNIMLMFYDMFFYVFTYNLYFLISGRWCMMYNRELARSRAA